MSEENKDITEAVTEPKIKTTAAEYSSVELMSVSRAKFGVEAEVAGAALKLAGKNKATVTEAKLIIDKFLKREVE